MERGAVVGGDTDSSGTTSLSLLLLVADDNLVTQQGKRVGNKHQQQEQGEAGHLLVYNNIVHLPLSKLEAGEHRDPRRCRTCSRS